MSSTVSKPQTAGAVKFVHLHNHSHYSLLDGLQKVPQMLDRVKELGMEAVALTDHGTMSGAIEFYNEAKKRSIKPILGLEAYIAPRSLHDKTGKVDANPYHLILLAKNNRGYQNLMQLATKAHLDGFYYKPRVDRSVLEQFKEGLIALSGCASGEVARHILNGTMAEAQKTVEWYRDTFGEGNYYLELQDHEEWDPQKQINKGLIELNKLTAVPLVVTADSHYTNEGDRNAHEILLCVQTGKTIGDTNRMEMEMSLPISSPETIAARWQHIPEAVNNTFKIADACSVELEMGKILIPKFQVPTGQTEQAYLHQLCWQGLMWRYADIPKEDMRLVTEKRARQELPEGVVQRADYELKVIGSMGFDGYFLIVADCVNWGKNQGIIFGPGRGSAAGSIIAYAMNITDLDPLKFDLLFERFLNPDRISMPDMDIDIQDSRRDEVIAYVTEKYGQNRVAQIITFGTMAARAAVRDTGRALDMPYAEVDAIAKKVPAPIQGRHIPLAASAGIIKSNHPDHRPDPELVNEYRNNPRAKRLIDLARRLEGTIRSNGVHAAGVVIAPDDIVNYTPLQRAQKGGIVTQYEMHALEDDIGLLKMDFLGLSNLTTIKNTLRIIKRVYGKTIDIADIPLDDSKTYELLSRGDTTGVFQLESAGMKRYIRELKPNRFDDIVAMVALYRPGPMQWIEDFINRKQGRRKIEYLHPKMQPALENSYGVIVYQEQVMQIAKEMCGFSGGQADALRKAIAKKKPKELAKMKTDFIEGGIKTVGAERALMEEFWGNLEAFAAYCFPKSHAACYALIAVQTAYLKASYPAAFMAALMTSDYGNIDRIAIEVAECRRMNIGVLPPDVNESFLEFGVVKGGDIRFGLSAIKNVGVGGIETILAARESGGIFTSVEDFAKRVSAAEVNRKVWEALIKSGAMDGFGERSLLLHNLDMVTSYASKAQKNALSGQIDIFGSMGIEDSLPALNLELPPAEVSNREKLSWERELLGLYLSHHPLDDFDAYLQDKTTPIKNLSVELEGRSVRIGGIITTVRKITTKNQASMAFVGLEDKTGTLELIVFPKAYEAAPELWETDQVVEVSGKVSTKDRDGRLGSELKVMVDKAQVIEYEAAKGHKRTPREEAPRPESPNAESGVTEEALTIRLTSLADTTILTEIKNILTSSPGPNPAYLIMPGSPPKKIKLPFNVAISEGVMDRLRQAVTDGEVARSPR